MNYGALLEMAARAGEIMLVSGAEVYRVEDTIRRILKQSGLEGIDVFVLTTGIVATLTVPGAQPLTLVRRVSRRETNLNRIYRVNDVSRHFCSGALTLEEAWAQLEEIAAAVRYHFWKKCAGYALTTGFFAILFGGGPAECAASAAVGTLLFFVLRGLARLRLNDFCQNAGGSFVLAAVSCGIRQWLLPQMNLDAVIISSLMPLVPGVTFTAAIRDTLNGDYSSGVARCAEAVVVALAVASGVGAAMLALGMTGGLA